MKKSAAAWVLGFGLLAAVVVLPQNVALPQTTPEGNSSKPAPEDIPPVRMIADPYPAFNGIAVDPERGFVAMSDPNRKSLLLYDRARDASKDGGISAPLRQIVGPDTFLGMIAGVDPRFATPGNLHGE